MIEIDHESLLVRVDANISLGELEAALQAHHLTLGLVTIDESSRVGEWIAAGAQGVRAAWLDPADHLVAGYVATFGGKRVEIRPAPRRATGPDLFSLVFGQQDRIARLQQAWLRVHRADAKVPRTAPFRHEDPAWTEDEERLTQAIQQQVE